MKRLPLFILLLLFHQSCRQKDSTLFTSVPTVRSGLDFTNQLEKREEFNILDYLYFYNGGGIAAGDINNDGLIDLYFTSNQGSNRLYLNQGRMQFKDITETAAVDGETGINKWTNGATMVDVNADGLLDIYVCEMNGYKNLQGRNRLYINQGDLTFQEQAADFGLDLATFAQHATFFDYDLDGDLDVFLLNQAVHTPNSYKKAEARKVRDSLSGDRLLRNDGGKFTDVSRKAGIYGGAMGYGLAVNISDLDGDGDPDIYVSNDFHENDYLYLNQGDGTFKETVKESFGHVSTFSMGSDIADINNDGRLDILTLDMKPQEEPILKTSSGIDPYDIYQYKLDFGYHYQYSRNMLQLNRGQLPGADLIKFSEIGQQVGIAATDWSWSALLADLDNDGKKDIFITNGIPARPNNLDYIRYLSNELVADSASALETIGQMPSGASSNYVFQSNGWSYLDRSHAWGLDRRGCSNGAVYADLDNDGDLDLAVNNLDDKASLFRNHAADQGSNYFLKVKLIGSPLNPDGIGVRAELYAGGNRQVLENHLSRGWLSGINLRQLHFGLGTNERIDSLTVRWPDGKRQTWYDLTVNSAIDARYQDANYIPDPTPKNTIPWLKEVTAASGINFKHLEVFHNDFAAEQLLPHLLSAEGPKIAVADVNSDGLEDFFIGGGRGQAGALFLQQENQNAPFRKVQDAPFKEHLSKEDIGAAFFDADQDGDVDLYVASGGSEYSGGSALRDRLYLNDGNGGFTYAPDALPTMEINSSCVVPFDLNEDGKMDLFIGNRSIPLQYGLPGVSKFLLNDGNGRFLDATVKLLEKGGRIGMVTDAVWIDERKELVVVGEWMPVRIYSFREGNIRRDTLPNTAGWWNAVEVIDIDGDGDRDLLLGNLGLNTSLSASPDHPLELYVKDYDMNLSTDPIMVYYRNGKQWVFPNLDLLAKQIVGVKNTYRSYERFAQKTFTEIFPKEQREKSFRAQVQVLESGILKYDGDYAFQPLPELAQIAPIYGMAVDDFDGNGKTDLLVGGNCYGNTPSIGRSDASYGECFEVSENGQLIARNSTETGFAVIGQVRDIKILSGASGKKYLLVARNNERVQIYTYDAEKNL